MLGLSPARGGRRTPRPVMYTNKLLARVPPRLGLGFISEWLLSPGPRARVRGRRPRFLVTSWGLVSVLTPLGRKAPPSLRHRGCLRPRGGTMMRLLWWMVRLRWWRRWRVWWRRIWWLEWGAWLRRRRRRLLRRLRLLLLRRILLWLRLRVTLAERRWQRRLRWRWFQGPLLMTRLQLRRMRRRPLRLLWWRLLLHRLQS